MPLGGGVGSSAAEEYIPVCYVIDKEGSYYVPREGEQESKVSSSQLYSTVVNACHANLDEGGEIFCKKNEYEVDALITLGGDRDYIKRLEFEAGSIIKPKTDIDMFYVKQNGQMINGYYYTTDISFSKSVVLLGEGESYFDDLYSEYKFIPEMTFLKNLRGMGGFGAGKGNFVYLHAEQSDAIALVNTDNIWTYGFTYPLFLHLDHEAGWAYINGNRFKDWSFYNPVIGIYCSISPPPLTSDLLANKFEGIQFEKGPDTTHAIKCDGIVNWFEGVLWDMGAALAEFTKYSSFNKARLMVPKANVLDLGCNNVIELLGIDAIKGYTFKDKFMGDNINPAWNVVSGAFSHIGGGEGLLLTGALTGNEAEINWNGKKRYRASNKLKLDFQFYPNRGTTHEIEIRLYEDANNYIYIILDTVAGDGILGCVEDGNDTHDHFDPASWAGSRRYYLNISSSLVTLFETYELVAEVASNIPNGYMEPNIRCKTLEDAAFRVYAQEFTIIVP